MTWNTIMHYLYQKTIIIFISSLLYCIRFGRSNQVDAVVAVEHQDNHNGQNNYAADATGDANATSTNKAVAAATMIWKINERIDGFNYYLYHDYFRQRQLEQDWAADLGP
jgi:hypothetical protein